MPPRLSSSRALTTLAAVLLLSQMSAEDALACTVRGQEVSSDCTGVTVTRETTPFQVVAGRATITGLSEGARIVAGGDLELIGNADLVIVEEGATATIHGVVHNLENRGGEILVTGVVDTLHALAGTTVVEGIVEAVTGPGAVDRRPGSEIEDVVTE